MVALCKVSYGWAARPLPAAHVHDCKPDKLPAPGWNEAGGYRPWDPSTGLQHQLHCSRAEKLEETCLHSWSKAAKISDAFTYTRQCFDNRVIFSSNARRAEKYIKTNGCHDSTHRKNTNVIRPCITSPSFHCSRYSPGKLVMTLASRGNNASDAEPRTIIPRWWVIFRSGLHTVKKDVFKDSVRLPTAPKAKHGLSWYRTGRLTTK